MTPDPIVFGAYQNQPDISDFLQANKFTLELAYLPGMMFFCQSVTIPGLSVSPIYMPNPVIRQPVPGGDPNYDLLEVEFKIDAKLENYRNLKNWLESTTNATGMEDIRSLIVDDSKVLGNRYGREYIDAAVTIYSPLNNPIASVVFEDTFPTGISGLKMSTTDSSTVYLTATAAFAFTRYDILAVE